MKIPTFVKNLLNIFVFENSVPIDDICDILNIPLNELYQKLSNFRDILDFTIQNDTLQLNNLDEIKKQIQAEELVEKTKNLFLDLDHLPQGYVKYQETAVSIVEADVLKQLAKLIDYPIISNPPENFQLGFAVKNGHVIKLGISYKQLPKIPSSIGKLEYLEEINLSHMGIQKIPPTFTNLQELKKINFEYNQIKQLPRFHKFKKLQYLDLSHNLIQILPEDLIYLANLQFLGIAYNQIKVKQAFPIIKELTIRGVEIIRTEAFYWQEISNSALIVNSKMNQEALFNNLLALDTMQSFEDSCSHMLDKLSTPDVVDKSKDFLEEYQYEQDGLEEEEFDSENIEDWALIYQDAPLIKDEHDYMVYLENLLKNPIPRVKKVEQTFGFISRGGYIQELGFVHVNLTSIPDIIVLFSNLKTLSFANNQITSLSEWIGEMVSLKKLILQNNALFVLPATIGNLENLEYLDLSYNRLIQLPTVILDLPSLKQLDVSHNQLNMHKDGALLHQLAKKGCKIYNDQAYQLPK